MDDKIRYHSHKLEREEDLFCSALNYAGTNTTVINQVEYSDVFYSTYYFSDGNLTDINVYYVTSKKLQNEINRQQSNIIKFDPGTRSWSAFKGEMRDTSTWLFVLRVLFTSSREIEEIQRLESEYKRLHKSHQSIISEQVH
ncbi:hypothetical protein C6988_08540 [Nitrosopumilus sp. b1]|uniref:hypothetical protein n=1 Tax=Nitrosopumilus sp. b1 TaxID=2109907 RepID=UPI0015F576ED|nr:hypothetical protein [Nitrosopumilus sp. b1]KAF6242435.1 hypothetical protein C6988_08540 [Nitrosopumilus sp. b1]